MPQSTSSHWSCKGIQSCKSYSWQDQVLTVQPFTVGKVVHLVRGLWRAGYCPLPQDCGVHGMVGGLWLAGQPQGYGVQGMVLPQYCGVQGTC